MPTCGVPLILPLPLPLPWTLPTMPAAHSGRLLGDASRDELAVRLGVVVVVVVLVVCPDVVKWSAFPVELVRACRNRIDRIRWCAWELLLLLLRELVPAEVEVDGPPPSIISCSIDLVSGPAPWAGWLCGAAVLSLLTTSAYRPRGDCEKGNERKRKYKWWRMMRESADQVLSRGGDANERTKRGADVV